MVSEADKYLAYSCQIGSFALMAPAGNIVLRLLDLKLEDFNVKFFIYLLIAAFLFIIGIISLAKGYEILDLEEKFGGYK